MNVLDTTGPSARTGGATDDSLSKSERAYRWLRQQITEHRFAPGHRLVLLPISLELQMSVVQVREAIRRLEAEGLVTVERNVGAQVAMTDENQYAETMQTLGLSKARQPAWRHRCSMLQLCNGPSR